jgi:hypothetical protein
LIVGQGIAFDSEEVAGSGRVDDPPQIHLLGSCRGGRRFGQDHDREIHERDEPGGRQYDLELGVRMGAGPDPVAMSPGREEHGRDRQDGDRIDRAAGLHCRTGHGMPRVRAVAWHRRGQVPPERHEIRVDEVEDPVAFVVFAGAGHRESIAWALLTGPDRARNGREGGTPELSPGASAHRTVA